MSEYGRDYRSVELLSGDSVPLSKVLATKLQSWLLTVKGTCRSTPLIGCSSHRLSLAVNALLVTDSQLVQKVHDLVVALRHPKSWTRLASAVFLTPEVDQATRWGSTYTILVKYLKVCLHFA